MLIKLLRFSFLAAFIGGFALLTSCSKDEAENQISKANATHYGVTKIEVTANYPNGAGEGNTPDIFVIILEGSTEVFNNIDNYLQDTKSGSFNISELMLKKDTEYTIQLWDRDIDPSENDDLMGQLNITPSSAQSGDNPPLVWDSFTVYTKLSGSWK